MKAVIGIFELTNGGPDIHASLNGGDDWRNLALRLRGGVSP